ncbi:MAG TPA: isoprenylcysteine carboxylmethyltransferase family protein [Candidatus Sulfotelmatobacter sp.]|jgi:protein-S-isoprenylcysteine O-methyltransferase Ste14
MNNRNYYAFSLVQILAVCALLWFLFTLPGPWEFQRDFGTVLLLIGVIGLAAARYQLGRSFAVRAEAHQLVTRGIYSRIRNPIYVFGAILIAGVILILHRPALCLFLIAIIILQVVRAHREARVLEAAFGDAYREYRRKTWF